MTTVPTNEGAKTGRQSWIILGVAALILLAAIGISVGRQWGGDAASGTGAAASAASLGDPLAELTARAAAAPSDPAIWEQLGEARFAAEDFGGAADAFRRVTTIAPQRASGFSALGEALVMASRSDPMPADALAAFRKAKALDAADPRARYFLAVRRDLDGDHRGAIDDWLALLADTPAGAPWESDLRRTIEQVGKIHTIEVAARLASVRQPAPKAADLPVAARAIPGPTAEQMRDAASLPKGQQDAMIDGMVASLESKLAANPANVDGWIMLMRSRMTLGQSEQAGAALKKAVAANPAAAQRLQAEARLLSVPGA